MMIPRYISTFGLRSALSWLIGPKRDPADSLASLLNEMELPRTYATAVESLRRGLFLWFDQLRKKGAQGRVLMSAQICPVVPKVIEQAGFTASFVDIDVSWPTPTAEQFCAALDDDTVAVIVSPLYGYLPEDWSSLLDRLGARALVLDMAQGLCLKIPDPLARRANAIGFSFGLGKGMDTGGGLILTKEPLAVEGRRVASVGLPLVSALQGAMLQLLVSSGGYRYLRNRMKDVDDNELGRFDERTCYLAPAELYGLWQTRLGHVTADFQKARARAVALGKRDGVVRSIKDAQVYLGATPTHLRQVLRLRDATTRDTVVRMVRAAGIDCAQAGELLPQDYLQKSPQAFPNAAAFRADSIRLPFLGRLDEAAFVQLAEALETNFAKHLS